MPKKKNDLLNFAANRLGIPGSTVAEARASQFTQPRFANRTIQKAAGMLGIPQSALQQAAAARKDPFSAGFHPELSDIAGQIALRRILASGGLTPAQREALARVANRVLAQQAQVAGAGLGRRFAAQGIENTGLATAGLSGIFNQLLGAQQAQQGRLDELSLGILQSAIRQLFGAEQAQAGRRFQESLMGDPLGRILGTVLASFTGGFAGQAGQNLAGRAFRPPV